MRISKTHRLYLIIILLASINVTIITLFSSHLKGETKSDVEQISVPNTHLGRFFKSELDLNAEQHQQFRSFRQTYHRESNTLLSGMHIVRENILKELQSTAPNRKKLDNYAEKIGAMHVILKQLTYDYYLNMQSVLEENQKEGLAIIFQSMLTDEGNAKTPEHDTLHYQTHTEDTESDSCTKENIDF